MKTTSIILSSVAALILLPVGCSLYSVYTAPSRVITKTLETSNIIQNYELFHDLGVNFDARIAQINEHRGFLTAETDKAERSRIRMEMAAQQQSCRELAAEYNANSAKLNRLIFKDRGLRPNLDTQSCE